MMLSGDTAKTKVLLQSIAAHVGVTVVIATDNAAELADEMREPTDSEREQLEVARFSDWVQGWMDYVDSAYMQADLGTHTIVSVGEVNEIPNTEFGSRAWFAGIDEEEF